jgi:hypothetical protein
MVMVLDKCFSSETSWKHTGSTMENYVLTP